MFDLIRARLAYFLVGLLFFLIGAIYSDDAAEERRRHHVTVATVYVGDEIS